MADNTAPPAAAPVAKSAHVVPRADQYENAGIDYFRLKFPEGTHEDIPKDLALLKAPELRKYAKLLGLRGFSKLRKAELLAAVTPLIKFE
jgi:hypothetical protein